MNKLKKNALKTGICNDNNCYYKCPDCGKQNTLNSKRCVFCNAKRPHNAYEQTIAMQQPKQEYCGFADRTVKNAYPTPPNPAFAVPLPSCGCENGNYQLNSLANLPDYYSTDEYGRVFQAKVSYGALPCSSPVPVPTPSKTVQVSAINVPLNLQNNTNN